MTEQDPIESVKSKKVALILSSPELRKELAQLLIQNREHPVRLFEADCGESGARLLERESPDVALIDLILPREHGFELCQRIKSRREARDSKVVLLADPMESDRHRQLAQAVGADLLLEKPVSAEETAALLLEMLISEHPESGPEPFHLDNLARDFASQLDSIATELTADWEKLQQSPSDVEAAEQIYRVAHRLHGGSATLGLGELSRAAAELEYEISKVAQELRGEHRCRQTEREDLEACYMALQERLQAPVRLPLEARPIVPRPSKLDRNRTNRILLVDDDMWINAILTNQLSQFGYRTVAIERLSDFEAKLEEVEPDAIICDLGFPEGELAGPQALGQLRQARGGHLPPVVYLSSRRDFEARLEAVRSGCVAFLEKPARISELVEVLDRSTAVAPDEPFRVLVVDDDETFARFAVGVLREWRMVAEMVTHPSEVDEALRELRPDVLLMDLHLPGCSGIELSRMIRLNREFLPLSIVFVSVERALENQLDAIENGGDDFLIKPISARYLAIHVAARASRSRTMTAQIQRDGLTGLLTHSIVVESLEAELARARRSGEPLTFAMMDIDDFKGINDRYGHNTGDSILQSLARLLRTRLRATDISGRYGGDEFAVVLPATGVENAKTLLETIRGAFSSLEHPSPQGLVATSMSVGLAGWTGQVDGLALQEAADKALYAAKRSGRDRVEVSA